MPISKHDHEFSVKYKLSSIKVQLHTTTYIVSPLPFMNCFRSGFLLSSPSCLISTFLRPKISSSCSYSQHDFIQQQYIVIFYIHKCLHLIKVTLYCPSFITAVILRTSELLISLFDRLSKLQT